MEICEFGLGGNIGASDPASGAAHVFVGFAVVVFIVALGAIADHGHYVGEDGAGSIILVCVEEDSEAFEAVGAAEDGAGSCALFGEPHGEAVAVKVAVAVDSEFNFNLCPDLTSAVVLFWKLYRWEGRGTDLPIRGC